MKLKAPLDVQIELTTGCNYNCVHCYNGFKHNGSSMSSMQLHKIINELSYNEVFDAILTGGEPFINKEVLYEGIEKLAEKGIFAYVNTNLSIPLKNEDVIRLSQTKNILFSFPSQNPELFIEIAGKQEQKQVFSNLELLIRENLRLSANQVVSPINLKDVYNTGRFLFERFNITHFSATPANPNGYSKDNPMLQLKDYELILRQLKSLEQDYKMNVSILTCIPHCIIPADLRNHKMIKRGCSSGESTLGIGINGGVRKCIMLQKEYGNLNLESLSSIWNKISSEEKPQNIHCQNCVNVKVCNNGCEYRAIETGTDPLIQGELIESTPSIHTSLNPTDTYHLKKFRKRKETEDNYTIFGADFVINGNSKFVSFLEKISCQSFSLEEIKKTLGFKGIGLLEYLNIRGLIKKDGN